MKNNQLTSMLVGLLCLCALGNAGLVIYYNRSISAIKSLQPQITGPTMAQNLMQNLLNDANQYNATAKNPDLKRILDGVTGANNTKPAK